MKNIRILSELGSDENKALLCEIPSDWASDIPIARDGSIDAIGLLKLIRKSIITEHLKNNVKAEPFDAMMKRFNNSSKTHKDDVISLYEMIYNPNLAVNLKEGKAS